MYKQNLYVNKLYKFNRCSKIFLKDHVFKKLCFAKVMTRVYRIIILTEINIIKIYIIKIELKMYTSKIEN